MIQNLRSSVNLSLLIIEEDCDRSAVTRRFLLRTLHTHTHTHDYEIYAYNNKNVLRSNRKGYGGKTH